MTFGAVNVATAQFEEESADFFKYWEMPSVYVASKKHEKISDAPSILTVVTKDEIKAYGAHNLRDIFDRMPAMQVTGSQMIPETAVTIRGQGFFQENSHVLLLINGRPFRESLTQGLNSTFIGGIPVDLVERIEVIRGPGSVLYGTGAFSGVINVILKSPQKLDKLYAAGTSGSFGSTKAELIVSDSNADHTAGYVIGAKHFTSDGWKLKYTDQFFQGHTFETDETDTGIYLDAFYKQLRLTGFFGELQQKALQASGAYPLRNISNRNVFLDASWHHPIHDDWKLETYATYHFFDLGNYKFKNEDILLEATLIGHIHDNIELVVGSTYENLKNNSEVHDTHLAMHQSEQPLSVYGQIDYRFNDMFKLVYGVQYNKPVDQESGVSPRISVLGRLNKYWSLKLNCGEAYRSPNSLESYLISPDILYGNPQLKPETIKTYECQVLYTGTRFAGALSYYHSNIKDLISRTGFPIRHTNGGLYGEVEFDGVEFEGKINLSDFILLQFNAFHQQNETQFGIEGTTFTPETMLKAGLIYENFNYGLTMGVFDAYFGTPTDIQSMVPHFVPAIPVVNGESESYHLVTFNMSLNLNSLLNLDMYTQLIFNLFVDNLLDEEINFPDINAQHVNSYTIHAPRSTYLTLKLKY